MFNFLGNFCYQLVKLLYILVAITRVTGKSTFSIRFHTCRAKIEEKGTQFLYEVTNRKLQVLEVKLLHHLHRKTIWNFSFCVKLHIGVCYLSLFSMQCFSCSTDFITVYFRIFSTTFQHFVPVENCCQDNRKLVIFLNFSFIYGFSGFYYAFPMF